MKVRHRYRGEGVVLGEVEIDGREFLEVAFSRVDFDSRDHVETVLVLAEELETFLDDDLPFKHPPLHKYEQVVPGRGRKASNARPDGAGD